MAMEMSPAPLPEEMRSLGNAAAEKEEAEAYLQSLINKTLRVYTTDARLFVGTLKCTDPVSIGRRPSVAERGN